MSRGVTSADGGIKVPAPILLPAEAGNWFPDKVGKNMSQSFGSALQDVGWGQTHKPREKTSKSRITELPVGRFLCSECFLGLLFSQHHERKPCLFTPAYFSGGTFQRSQGFPHPEQYVVAVVTPGESDSEVIQLELLGSGGFPHCRILQSHSWAYIWRKPNSKRYMHPNVHCSTIYDSQNMEAN